MSFITFRNSSFNPDITLDWKPIADEFERRNVNLQWNNDEIASVQPFIMNSQFTESFRVAVRDYIQRNVLQQGEVIKDGTMVIMRGYDNEVGEYTYERVHVYFELYNQGMYHCLFETQYNPYLTHSQMYCPMIGCKRA